MRAVHTGITHDTVNTDGVDALGVEQRRGGLHDAVSGDRPLTHLASHALILTDQSVRTTKIFGDRRALQLRQKDLVHKGYLAGVPVRREQTDLSRSVTVATSTEPVRVLGRSYPSKPTEVKNRMRKHIRTAARLALGVATLSGASVLGTLGAGAANAAPIASSSPGNFSPVVGHVYLDDNTAGTNTISGFDRHLDGSLTPLPGSPFTAGDGGGVGCASSQRP